MKRQALSLYALAPFLAHAGGYSQPCHQQGEPLNLLWQKVVIRRSQDSRNERPLPQLKMGVLFQTQTKGASIFDRKKGRGKKRCGSVT